MTMDFDERTVSEKIVAAFQDAERWRYVRDRIQFSISGSSNEPYVNLYFPKGAKGDSFTEVIDNLIKIDSVGGCVCPTTSNND